MVQGKTLKCVKKFKYLGGQLSNDTIMFDEIPWRIQQTSAAFSKLYQRVLKKKHLTLKTKVKTYKTMIHPCMLYGSETWNCSNKHLKKLNGLQYHQLRTTCGKNGRKHLLNGNFTWAIPEDESKEPDLKSPETLIMLSRLRYAGYVIRMEDNRLPKIILHAETNEGQRKIGCPKKISGSASKKT